MTALIRAISVGAAALLLAGCASTNAATPTSSARAAAANSTASMPMTPGQSMAGMSMTSSAPANRPTATALMVCSDDIKGKVKQVLALSSAPRTTSAFANEIYSCTYDLSVGPLLLSVQHSESKAAADTYYNRVKASLGKTETLLGLGDKAFGSSAGVAVVMKDNETLVVDARSLPAVFGANQQKRTDLANEVASDVLGCWTGNE
ncbi:hypothetical protein M6D93_11505 [Jatrophihabitans telluris]|uniref:DUF3558 domain-containing protein n=1 Tax=Jatrophihabitans telluris TaxID=2038343 RepID=A0ABY4QV42_9ACTN|nr:hypothetical protein [Jatrophihabitans telluris]UQX86931.1 hypothetical protein M6D93_11505 [Jatrophihabitans telluris]